MPQHTDTARAIADAAFTNPGLSVAALKGFVGEVAGTEAPATLELVVLEDYDHYVELLGDFLRDGVVSSTS